MNISLTTLILYQCQTKSISLWEAIKYCTPMALLSIGQFIFCLLYVIIYDCGHSKVSSPSIFLTISNEILYSTGLTILVDSIMWKRFMWPEFEVFWFNSVLNRSSEWG